MSLAERIQMILTEQKVKQVAFAKSVGISANYVSLMVTGRRDGISEKLAKLIELCYGYSTQWIVDGTGEKWSTIEPRPEKTAVLEKLQAMSERDIRAVLAFIMTLEEINKDAE